jgi:hypothetical protein
MSPLTETETETETDTDPDPDPEPSLSQLLVIFFHLLRFPPTLVVPRLVRGIQTRLVQKNISSNKSFHFGFSCWLPFPTKGFKHDEMSFIIN